VSSAWNDRFPTHYTTFQTRLGVHMETRESPGSDGTSNFDLTAEKSVPDSRSASEAEAEGAKLLLGHLSSPGRDWPAFYPLDWAGLDPNTYAGPETGL
jgi:hypothetical protein